MYVDHYLLYLAHTHLLSGPWLWGQRSGLTTTLDSQHPTHLFIRLLAHLEILLTCLLAFLRRKKGRKEGRNLTSHLCMHAQVTYIYPSGFISSHLT